MESKSTQLATVKRVEVLPPEVQSVALSLAQAELHTIVQQQLAEALAQKDGILIEPFFRERRIAEEIRRLQFVPERKKWSIYYDKWGCLRCGTNRRQHTSHGMCLRCNVQIVRRLKEIVRELRGEKEHHVPRVCEDCGRRFPAMTDTKWESVYEQHKISRKHNRKILRPAERAAARSCALCEKYFHPMTRITWNHVRQQHERGYRHRLALRKRKAR
jgi:hypothetical protein